MKLKQFLEASDGHICGGSEYLWKCWPDARYIDISNINGKEVGHAVFSTKTHEVYEASASVDDDDVCYRWIDPNWLEVHSNEAVSRNVDIDIAYDLVKFTDVSSDELLELIPKIVHMTYVHSHHAIGQDLNITPAALERAMWGDRADESLHANYREGPCCGGEHCREEDHCSDVDEFKEAGETTEYEVKLTVLHRLSVRANNMEGAIIKARGFDAGMKPVGAWGEGVCWEDHYVTKAEVTQNFVSEYITE